MEAAHPGFTVGVQACDTTAKELLAHPAPITRPAVPLPPPANPGVMPAPVDAFAMMIYEVFSQEGTRPGFKGRAAQNCVIALLSAAMTPAEKQMLIDTKFHPSDEQGNAVDKAHPGLFAKLDACEEKQ